MIDIDKSVGAVFFIPPDARSEHELLALASVEVKVRYDTDPPALSSLWTSSDGVLPFSGIGNSSGCFCVFLNSPRYRRLVIYFSERRLTELFVENGRRARASGGALPIENDAALPLATAFRDACERLRPDLACVTARRSMILPEYLDHYERTIQSGKLAQVVADSLAMVYVSERLEADLVLLPHVENNERFPVSSGLLLLGGRGLDRWWHSRLRD